MHCLAAAFARLCVETAMPLFPPPYLTAAAFARLCVETRGGKMRNQEINAAAFARLCVETSDKKGDAEYGNKQPPSRGCVLKHRNNFPYVYKPEAAAFARLCVETLEFCLPAKVV